MCDFFALIKGVSMSILLSNINGDNIKQMILCVFLVEIKAHYSSLVSCSNMQSIFCPIKKNETFRTSSYRCKSKLDSLLMKSEADRV